MVLKYPITIIKKMLQLNDRYESRLRLIFFSKFEKLKGRPNEAELCLKIINQRKFGTY